MNKRLVFIIITFMSLTFSAQVFAQTPPPGGPTADAGAPLDALTGVLLIIGAAKGGWNLRQKAK